MTTQNTTEAPVDLDRLVAEADTGGRSPTGAAAAVLTVVAVTWSLFQLWYASPLPFMLGFGVLNDTEARAIHLGFAIFLAFLAYPALKSSPRTRIPLQDWLMAGGFSGVDCAVGWSVWTAGRFVRLSPALQAYVDRCTQRPAFRRALPQEGEPWLYDRDFYELPDA